MSAMGLQTALSEAVAFIREHGGGEISRMRQVCKRLEVRITNLQGKREARAQGRVCKRCSRGCAGLLCYRCWDALPPAFRGMFNGAKTDSAKREAVHAILDFIKRHPMEVAPC